MIAWISGVLVDKEPNIAVISVHGLGYQVELTLRDWEILPPLNEQVTVFVQAIYREDSQLLFGFIDHSAKKTFTALNKASGVGPKMALQILDTYSLEELSLFVAQGNHMAFTRVKGVGPKLAKRLMIDLKGKLLYTSCPERAMQSPTAQQEAIDALIHLGYKEARARVMAQQAEGMTVEAIIKSALQKEGIRA
jgi:holliday junction DNA helicase RuvA